MNNVKDTLTKVERSMGLAEMRLLCSDYYQPKTNESKRGAFKVLLDEWQTLLEIDGEIGVYEPGKRFTENEVLFWEFIHSNLNRLNHSVKQDLIALNANQIFNLLKENNHHSEWEHRDIKKMLNNPIDENFLGYKTVHSIQTSESIKAFCFYRL